MIGFFLRNKQDEICFALAKKEPHDIASFHYLPGPRIIAAAFSNGDEETITSEIAQDIHDALVKAKIIFVAELNEKAEAVREYAVPLKIS